VKERYKGQLLGDLKAKKDTEFKQDTGTWKGKALNSIVWRTVCDRLWSCLETFYVMRNIGGTNSDIARV